jgi:hypothetical protein
MKTNTQKPKQEVYTDLEADSWLNDTPDVYSHIATVVDLVNRYPNDAELGENIRKFINTYYNHE